MGQLVLFIPDTDRSSRGASALVCILILAVIPGMFRHKLWAKGQVPASKLDHNLERVQSVLSSHRGPLGWLFRGVKHLGSVHTPLISSGFHCY